MSSIFPQVLTLSLSLSFTLTPKKGAFPVAPSIEGHGCSKQISFVFCSSSCIRFIYGLHGHQEDYLPYMRETHILPVEQRVIFKACLMAYKIVHGSAPDYLIEHIPTDIVDVTCRTRSTAVQDPYKLQYPKLSSINANSKLRKRRPSVLLPDLWNALPLELRSRPSVESFKTGLKTRLFVEAFGDN